MILHADRVFLLWALYPMMSSGRGPRETDWHLYVDDGIGKERRYTMRPSCVPSLSPPRLLVCLAVHFLHPASPYMGDGEISCIVL